jgi:hypothetical protein
MDQNPTARAKHPVYFLQPITYIFEVLEDLAGHHSIESSVIEWELRYVTEFEMYIG